MAWVEIGSSEDVGYAAFPSFLGGRTSAGLSVALGSTHIYTANPFFEPTDVGQPVYSYDQFIPVGSVIATYYSSTHVSFWTPNSPTPFQGSTASDPFYFDTVGIGGCIIETVQSAIQMWRGRGGLWKGRAQAIAS